MNPARRRRYLDALGIETWVARGSAASPAAVEAVERAESDAASDQATAPKLSSSPPSSSSLSTPSAPMPASIVRETRAVATPSASTNLFSDPVEMAKAKPPVAAPVLRDVPTDWAGLAAAVSGCTECKLCRTRTNTVFGVGLPLAPLMVVGEGPGADEDAQGQPFVGRAGKLLDEMLKAIGRTRQESAPEKSVYIANVVKCRPPANRDPEADEVEACRPYLDQQIRLIQPKLIVALGRIAAQRLLATDEPLSKLRGNVYAYGSEQTPVMITYHPAYLLRSPGEKAKSWADLKRVHQFLAG